jgi:hypothetical protein
MAVSVSGLESGVAAITAGGLHSCALMLTGGVNCWGFNEFGQLGDGTTTISATPVNVKGLSGIAAVTTGNYHSCALTSGGGVKCWGANEVGQLGDGTSSNRSAPVDVAGLTSGAAPPQSLLRATLAAGGRFTCAVTATGGAKCWGRNAFGQLGDGRACGEDCPAPVNVSGLGSGVSAVAAGNVHACALMTSGTLKCWGANGAGQVGDGTTTERTTPVDVVVKRPPATATATVTDTPTTTATATATVTPTKQPAPGDTDGDGCTDEQENGTNEGAGGNRDYLSFWDFFDTPAGPSLTRDRRVTIADVGALVQRFGSVGDADLDPLAMPPAPPTYHTAFDRTPPEDGDAWDTGPPDGRVTIVDITLIVVQFGHTCAF